LAGEIVPDTLRWIEGDHDTCRESAGLQLISSRHGAMVARCGELINCLSEQIVYGRFAGAELY
jgi:hypothetical protein